MPEPVRTGQRYMPGLDGLRAIAVLAVIAFHEQFGWAPGRTAGGGRVLYPQRLPDHRPAARALVGPGHAGPERLLAAAGAAAAARAVRDAGRGHRLGHAGRPRAAAEPARGRGRGRDLLQQLVPDRVAQLVLRAVRTASAAGPPVVAGRGGAVLPGLAVAAAARPAPGAARRDGAVRWLALPTLVLAAASTFAMLVLYHPGLDPTRIYEGTDTRAAAC